MEDDEVLKNVAREIEGAEFDRGKAIQKTFVISRRSLSFLDKVTSNHNASRDALVGYSVRRLLPIIATERKKHQKRKKLRDEISNNFASGEHILAKAETMLGKDDPVFIKLQTAMSAYQMALGEIANVVERGKRIEAFPSE
jgi:hypothetical protein